MKNFNKDTDGSRLGFILLRGRCWTFSHPDGARSKAECQTDEGILLAAVKYSDASCADKCEVYFPLI